AAGLELLFTWGEEVGHRGAKAFDRSLARSRHGFVLDALMPVGSIVVAAPTYDALSIKIHGRAARAGWSLNAAYRQSWSPPERSSIALGPPGRHHDEQYRHHFWRDRAQRRCGPRRVGGRDPQPGCGPRRLAREGQHYPDVRFRRSTTRPRVTALRVVDDQRRVRCHSGPRQSCWHSVWRRPALQPAPTGTSAPGAAAG